MKKILCLGDACADIVIPYGAAKKGEDKSPEFTCGGTAANTASGLGKLGIDCAFLGKGGDDYFGRIMKRELEMDGVDTEYFKLDSNLSSVMILAVIDEYNDRFPFLMPKKKPSHLEMYDTDIPDDIFENISFVHTTGLMLFEEPAADTVCRFLEKCASLGIPVSLDINLRIETLELNREYLYRAIECANYLLGSGDDELAPLAGINDPFSAAKSFVTDKRSVVCRMGGKGSVAFDRLGEYHCDAYTVNVADTLGAGDSFNSGFIWALSKGKSLEYANKAGCAAAALNLTKRGARNCPSEIELLNFLELAGR